MKNAQDKLSFLTHFIGAVVSAVVFISFLFIGLAKKTPMVSLFSALIFAFSAILLYSASAIYHYVSQQSVHHKTLRKLDHAMIYVLIAGSYTPFVLPYFQGNSGMIYMLVMWGVAIVGIITKVVWLNAPRILYTALYLLMGWAAIFSFPTFQQVLPQGCLQWIIMGGVFYSIGGIIYIIKKPNLSLEFGFHELFHCFILLGTLAHALAVYFYVL